MAATMLRATFLLVFAALVAGESSFDEWLSALEHKATCKAEQESAHASGSGPHLGSMSWAPDWLQQPQEKGLYFTMAHPAVLDLQRFEDSAGLEIMDSYFSKVNKGVNGGLSYALGGVSYQFYITVALGSSNQLFNLLVDTGSFLLWMNCDCLPGGCPTNDTAAFYTLPLHPPFNTTRSSTLQTIPCNSVADCQSIGGSEFAFGCGVQPNTVTGSNCSYAVGYGGGSHTSGIVYKDRLRVGLVNGSSAEPTVTFGCGSYQTGSLVDGTTLFDGIIGFGISQFTLYSTLAAQNIISNTFSICMESTGAGGHLILGRTAYPPTAAYTPLVLENTFFWDGRLEEIVVGEVKLKVGELVTFDTGTAVTRLLTPVYDAMRKTLNDIRPLTETTFGNFTLPCFDVPTDMSFAQFYALLPPLQLSFPDASGTGSVYLHVPIWKYLQLLSEQNGVATLCFYCFPSNDFFILGGNWLVDMDILFDRENKRIGWVDVNCTSGNSLSIDGTAGAPFISFPAQTAGPPLALPFAPPTAASPFPTTFAPSSPTTFLPSSAPAPASTAPTPFAFPPITEVPNPTPTKNPLPPPPSTPPAPNKSSAPPSTPPAPKKSSAPPPSPPPLLPSNSKSQPPPPAPPTPPRVASSAYKLGGCNALHLGAFWGLWSFMVALLLV